MELKVLTNKDYRYFGRTGDMFVFERKGLGKDKELISLTKGKFVIRNLNLVFIFSAKHEKLEPTYATESRLEDLHCTYSAKFGNELSREEFTSKIIAESFSQL